jgi:hypothetical protein
LCGPIGLGSFFGKTHLRNIFESFLVAKQPVFKAFGDFAVAKMA